MPVVIERDKRSSTHTTNRSANVQPPARNHRLIYCCIVAIVVSWCLVAYQMFGGSIGRSAAVAPMQAPAGIKLALPNAP